MNDLHQKITTWAEQRGIYAHSTPAAQLLKAISEVGELADAEIKGDKAGTKDAIGDTLVCLVNFGRMAEVGTFSAARLDAACQLAESAHRSRSTAQLALQVSEELGWLAGDVARRHLNGIGGNGVAYALAEYAIAHGYTLKECLEAAWEQIKDRKGHMVPGGAFVKDELE